MRRERTLPSGASNSRQCSTSASRDIAPVYGGGHNRRMTQPYELSLEPTRDKKLLRRQLQAERLSMVDRHQRSVHLQEVLRVWLVSRPETSIGAYWPIKGEFDALPALYRWTEGEAYGRLIGLPV